MSWISVWQCTPTDQQTMVHPTVLPRLGHRQCLAPLHNVQIREKGPSALQSIKARALLNARSTKIRARERASATPPPMKRRARHPQRSGLALGTTAPNSSKPRMQTGAMMLHAPK